MLLLADSDISVVVTLLEREYNRRAEFSPLLWSKGTKFQLKEVYTRLRVVSTQKAGSSEIDVGDIFGSSEEGYDPLVLVEGSPGIGKTTFCLKLAHDWASGELSRNFPVFKLVFLLKCRNMKGDIVEDIFEQLLPEDLKEKTKEAFANFLEDLNNQKQILIILDGLDELPEKSKDRVNKVLGRKKLPFCYVLATTRQEKGICTREQFKLDICLAIGGFSEEDSLEYIRKHFRNIGTEHSSNGERLIEEIKQNPLLRHLQSNPLNLLLLCVVYEDHEGSLPASFTDLYQIIVRCLLKRYCAREELKAKKDEDSGKQFEITIQALGELAWNCLLNDRLSFYEEELEELERSNENIVARRLGLVYKEESLKRLKPRHAYSFLHKTFQEYLAASYIAHKFRGGKFQMLEQIIFPEITRLKFKQVFVFVCGILREEANIPFEEMGRMLQKQWDWLKCDDLTAKFFVNSWKETGNAERMARTLFSYLPFPRPLRVWNRDQYDVLRYVLKECAEFSEVLTVAEVHVPLHCVLSYGTDLLELPDVKSVIWCGECGFINYGPVVKHLNKTSAEKLTFALSADVGEGLSKVPDFGLSSVRLMICGSLGSSSLQDIENLMLHKFLSSLSITVCGDVQESLVEALARGLAGESAVKFLDLCVNGNFSFHGAYLLEKGILRNRSLKNVKVSVNGEPPENWQAVAKNLRAQFAEKAIVSAIYPNTFSKVKDSQVTHLNRLLSKTDLKQQTVTLNVWGELSSDGCKAVCEVLLHSLASHLTLNIHGQLTDEILRCTARCFKEQGKLSSITINAWVEMTEKETKLIKELGLDKNPSFLLNAHGTSAPLKESVDSKVISSDEPQSVIAFFEKAAKGPSKSTKGTSQKTLTMKITNDGDLSNEWEHGLGEGLAGNTSLKSLTLEIGNYGDTSKEWGRDLGEGLTRNTSLESLTMKIDNCGDVNNEWEHGLCEGLAGNTSLKSLTLEIGNYGDTSKEWGRGLGEGLARNTSLESLTMKIDNCGDANNEWEHGLGKGLAGNTSLKSLTLEIGNYGDTSKEWGRGLVEGLARNTSLESLTMKIDNCGDVNNEWEHGLGEGLAGNTSLKSLTLEIDNCGDTSKEWGRGLGEGLARNTSLKSLTLQIYTYGDTSKEWGRGLGEGLAQNTSLELLTMKIDNYGDESNEWEHGLGKGLAGNTSLKSLTLAIDNYGDTSKEWGRGLGEGLARNTSLLSLTLQIKNHGDTSKEWGRGLGEGLAQNTSLESLILKINYYGGMRNESEHGLGEGLAGNTSLKSVILEIDDCGDTSKEWGRGRGEGVAKNTSLGSLTMKINSDDDMSNQWEHGPGEVLAGNTSVNSPTLEIDNCGDTSKEYGHGLGEDLAQTTSLESLTMEINDGDMSSEWEQGLGEGLAGNTSLKSRTLEIDNCGDTRKEWGGDFGKSLARNPSLESLTMKMNNDDDMSDEWEHDHGDGLGGNISLKSLTLEIDNFVDTSNKWGRGLGESLARNSCLNSHSLAIKNDDYTSNCVWILGLVQSLATSTSLTSLTLAINNRGYTSNGWGHVLGESLAKSTSVNSLTLTINNYSYMSDECGVSLAEGLSRNTSLKSITLTMNNYFYMSSVWGIGLFEGSARNTSLKSFTLAINNYGGMKGELGHGLVEGLARNTSLKSITLAINNYGDMKGEWGHCLVWGLARNTSLNSLTLTTSNYCCASDVWGLGLAEGLARNTSLNSLTLEANNCGDMSEEWGCALREVLRKSKSSTECNLIVNICGKC